MGIGNKLSILLEKKNTNPSELAKQVGVSAQTIYSIIKRDSKKADIEVLLKIADILGVTVEYFVDDSKPYIDINSEISSFDLKLLEKYHSLDPRGKDIVETVLNREARHMTELKASQATVIDIHPRLENNTRFIEYHHSASAGSGVFILGSEGVDQLSIPDTPENRKVDYAIKVSGNSMEPDYNDGDIVLVSQKVELNHGDVGIFIINNNAYIKEYGETELISRNPEADNITISEYDNIVCMGKVVGKYKV